jgi:hypothetical protein
MNKKKVKIKGKYLNPLKPICCLIIPKTNKKKISNNFCHKKDSFFIKKYKK